MEGPERGPDVGEGNLALGTLALYALLTGSVTAVRATGLAETVAAAPHLAYHVDQVEVLRSTSDQVLQTASLVLVAGLALLLLGAGFRLRTVPDLPLRRYR